MDRMLVALIAGTLLVRDAAWRSMLRHDFSEIARARGEAEPNPNTQIVSCLNGAIGTGR